MMLLMHFIMMMMMMAVPSSNRMMFVDAFNPTTSTSETFAAAEVRIPVYRQAQHVGLQSRQHPDVSALLLKSSTGSGEDNEVPTNDEGALFSTNVTRSATSTTAPAALLMDNDDSATAASCSKAQFGDVVRLGGPSASSDRTKAEDSAFLAPATPISAKPTSAAAAAVASTEELVKDRKKQNILVAIASISLAVVNYLYQFTHPLSTLQLLATMQQDHAPQSTLKLLGNNGKPTMVDFWAPWCENCKQLAPTLYQIQQEYGRDVNFVMVNGDDPEAWPLIEAFGVDAIPHMALVEADGTVDTALIGPVPKAWLEADLNTLIENSRIPENDGTGTTRRTPLPYEMLDVFANRPEQRRLQVTIKE